MRIRQRKIDAKAFLSLLKKMLLGIFGERSDLGKPKVLRGSAVEKAERDEAKRNRAALRSGV